MKRTGLALSDELGITARALPNLTPRSRAEDIAFVAGLIAEHEVSDVVIGLASLPSGDDGAMGKRARGFADALTAACPSARVHLVDEAHTSQEATSRLVNSGVPKHKRKAALDGEVARGLVLDWLARPAG